MSYRNTFAYKARLDVLFEKGRKLNDPKLSPPEEIELKSEWAKYLCVLVSGFLEVAVKEAISEFSDEKSHPYIQIYVGNQLEWFMNPKVSKILALLESFNKDWKTDLVKNTTEEMRFAVDSIVANRNQIAHGKSIGLSLGTISAWYKQAQEFVDVLQIVCT